jgi:hypothetical protein
MNYIIREGVTSIMHDVKILALGARWFNLSMAAILRCFPCLEKLYFTKKRSAVFFFKKKLLYQSSCDIGLCPHLIYGFPFFSLVNRNRSGETMMNNGPLHTHTHTNAGIFRNYEYTMLHALTHTLMLAI